MMAKRSLANYQKVRASTASPAQRVLMVYQGIIKSIKQAVAACEDTAPDRFEKINNSVILAQNLILELKLALDKDLGGDIAKNLDSLYDFWRDHLSEANLEKSASKLREVLGMVEEMLESWEKAAEEIKHMK